ncbi:ribonuclease H-like domain-containing protein [Rhizophagus irregularis DAOM 181602=DAOM 197198]|nr:ribonuclease H-like domain-containing protein [Rhizophagus irregularis DAOM 181602=DAOM 197198]
MAIDPIDRSTWSISGGKEPILKFFKQYQLTKGTHLMTWKQYRSLALLPVQGRIARWYRDMAHLCTSRIDNLTGISVSYRPGYNDNGTIGWQDNGRVIPAHCCKRAILDRVSNSRGWSFPSEWLSSTHHLGTLIPGDRAPTSAPSPVISLPLVYDIWIHRWIDDDDLKSKLMDIRNILEERISVEYYTDGSLRTSIPTSRDQQDPNLVHTKMGAAFCVNDEPALSAQANLSLWPSSTRAELVAIFLALLTSPMNAKIKIYTDSQSAIYMINNRHNKSGRKLLKHNRKVRFFPTFKQIPIEYNLRKFIKTLMNTKVAAEWSMLKSNGHEIPIDWNITWNLIHRYKGFNCTTLLQRKPNLYKEFVCPRCNANKEENRHHFIECEANKDLWPIIKSRMQNDVISIIQKEKSKNILFLASLLDSFIIHFKELIWSPRCNATNAWEKAKNIGKKDKLNESENIDRYFKSSHQQIKQLKQNKQQLKKNNITNSQEDQMVEFGDTLLKLDSQVFFNHKNIYKIKINGK